MKFIQTLLLTIDRFSSTQYGAEITNANLQFQANNPLESQKKPANIKSDRKVFENEGEKGRASDRRSRRYRARGSVPANDEIIEIQESSRRQWVLNSQLCDTSELVCCLGYDESCQHPD